jgi:hypothetical protein
MIRVHGKAKYYKGAYKDTEEDRARYPLYSADSLELFNPPSAWLFDDFTNNTCLRTFPPRSQGACGSCWAFAASTMLSLRYCVAAAKAGIRSGSSDPPPSLPHLL